TWLFSSSSRRASLVSCWRRRASSSRLVGSSCSRSSRLAEKAAYCARRASTLSSSSLFSVLRSISGRFWPASNWPQVMPGLARLVFFRSFGFVRFCLCPQNFLYRCGRHFLIVLDLYGALPGFVPLILIHFAVISIQLIRTDFKGDVVLVRGTPGDHTVIPVPWYAPADTFFCFRQSRFDDLPN